MTKFRYKHIQSTVENKVPSDLLDGEIAVNRFAGKEKLFLKNASGDVVSFSSDSAIDGKLAEKLNVSDFNTYSGAVNTTINSKAAQSDLNTLSGTVTGHTADTDIHVTTADKTAWNNKVDDSDLVDFFDDAKYEMSGQTHVINFYNGNTVKATIDCTDFLVDGMIDDVRIETISGVTYLVIDFNTASGKEDIKIPLTDIFNPANYYTKSETSGATELTAEFELYTKKADIDQTINSTTSASTGAVSTSAVYGFVTSYTPSITVDQVIDSTTSASTNPVATKAVYSAITAHTENTNIHLSAVEKTNLDSLETNIEVISGISSSDVTKWNNSEEVSVSSGITPTDSSIELWVDESVDPATVEVYTKDELTGSSTTVVVAKAASATTAASVDSVAWGDVSGKPETFTPSAHNQESNTITAMTSYSIASASGAVATNDTLNTAVGKLEKRIALLEAATSGKVNTSTFTAHTASTVHMSTTEKTNLDSLATNIAAISGITSTKVSNWDGAATNSHTHSNKGVLDGISSSDITNWNSKTSNVGTVTSVQIGLPTGLSAATTAITESGKFDVKFSDGYSIPTTLKQGQWDEAYTAKHSHSNKSNLDSITGNVGTMAYENASSYSSATEVNSALAGKAATATTLAGYGITDAYTKDDLTGTSAVTVAKASSASTASSLSTSTARTVAANDFILLESANGTPVRISRDSFVQAVASVLNSNSQSTISQLFGADANGNHAAINTANLKKLLRVPSGFQHAISTNWSNEVQEIPNSINGGYIFLNYGDDVQWKGFLKYFHIMDVTTVTYGGRTLHIKRDTAGTNVKLVQEGSGSLYGGHFIFLPWVT